MNSRKDFLESQIESAYQVLYRIESDGMLADLQKKRIAFLTDELKEEEAREVPTPVVSIYIAEEEEEED